MKTKKTQKRPEVVVRANLSLSIDDHTIRKLTTEFSGGVILRHRTYDYGRYGVNNTLYTWNEYLVSVLIVNDGQATVLFRQGKGRDNEHWRDKAENVKAMNEALAVAKSQGQVIEVSSSFWQDTTSLDLPTGMALSSNGKKRLLSYLSKIGGIPTHSSGGRLIR